MFGFSTFSQTPFCSLPVTGDFYSSIVQENIIDLQDSTSSIFFAAVLVNENLVFNDAVNSSLDFINSVQEFLEVPDPSVSPFISINTLINELTELSSQLSSTITFSFFVVENVQASSLENANVDFFAALQEVGVVSDSAFGRLLWELINDSQPQAWQNFGTDSNPIWGLVVSSSGSTWTTVAADSPSGWSLVNANNSSSWDVNTVSNPPNWNAIDNNQTQTWQNFGTDSNPVWGVVVSDGSSSWVVILANSQNGWPAENNFNNAIWNAIKTLN